MAYETGRAYTQSELPAEVFGAGNGTSFGGQKLIVNNNGTRSFEGGGSGSSPRLDYVNGLTDNLLTIDNANAGKQNDARSALVGYYSGLEKNTDAYKRLSDENGVTQQQKLVDSLTRDVMNSQDLVDAIPDSVKQRSGDFLVNDADKTAITAHEQKPVIDNLTKLLRSKQYEEIGLAGKQQLVSTLLQLKQSDDEMGAKPLQLGVDYTTEDRNAARDLLTSIMGVKVGAFSGDQSAAEAAQENEKSRQFQSDQQDKSFSQQTSMANLTSKNSLANDLALKEYDTAQKKGTGTGTTTGSYNKATNGEIVKVANIAKTSKNPKSDIWNYIHSIEPNSTALGVNTAPLWNIYNAAQDVNPAKQKATTSLSDF